MARGEGGGAGAFRGRAGGLLAGLALLGVLTTTGGVGRWVERLAGIVPAHRVVAVADAARRGDVRATTDRLGELVRDVGAGAGAIAREVAAGAGDPEEGPCPGPDPAAAPTVSIRQHDGWGGHTERRHVGKPVEELQARLAASDRMGAASTFASVEQADSAVSAAWPCVAEPLQAWVADGMPGGRLHCRVELEGVAGTSVLRGRPEPVDARGVELRFSPAAHSPLGFRLSTAFPEATAVGVRCGS